VLAQQGGQVVSVDPLYRFSAEQIAVRINQTSELILAQVVQNRHQFVWRKIVSPDHLARLRHEAMQKFLSDYSAGKAAGRYLAGELPALDFPARRFELALCSHLLFLYSEQISRAVHFQAIEELCRVAAEVRIFPLVDLDGGESAHLQPLIANLDHAGYAVSIRPVAYEFQKGGNQMMVVSCEN
jgi:hypothetical protein